MQNASSPAVALRVVVDDTAQVSENIETLARRYHAELLRVLCARLRDEQDAADIAQEAYARLIRYQGQFTGDELRRMLFRIARNLLTDRWRWNRLRGADTHLPIDEMDIESTEPSVERQISGEQRLARLEETILAMPGKRRAVFILSRIEGLSNSEVAARCGISVKTVEKHIALALAECRLSVGDDEL